MKTISSSSPTSPRARFSIRSSRHSAGFSPTTITRRGARAASSSSMNFSNRLIGICGMVGSDTRLETLFKGKHFQFQALDDGDAAVRAAQRATASIPILAFTDDMLGQDFVRSLAKPGGNTTGVTIFASELDGKRQEILIEAVSGIRRIATLADSNVSTPTRLRALEDDARARGIELSIHSVARREEIGSAIDAAKAVGAEGLNVLASALLFNSRAFIFDRAA